MFVELVPKSRSRETAEVAKRVLDVLGAAAGILILAPLFLLIGLAIKLTTPGSIFVAQERHGYGRRRFLMFKFRSIMPHGSDRSVQGPGFTRMTPLGRFLRRTLLDELPVLWNVLLGTCRWWARARWADTIYRASARHSLCDASAFAQG